MPFFQFVIRPDHRPEALEFPRKTVGFPLVLPYFRVIELLFELFYHLNFFGQVKDTPVVLRTSHPGPLSIRAVLLSYVFPPLAGIIAYVLDKFIP